MFLLSLSMLVVVVLCPIVGYDYAMDRVPRRRRVVIAWSTTSGAIAGLLAIALLINSERGWSYDPAGEQLRRALGAMGVCALFGLALGVTGLLMNARSARRLLGTGVAILGLPALDRRIELRVQRLLNPGGLGVVLFPDNTPIPGMPVFLAPGDGALERLTTDGSGRFRIRLAHNEYQHATLLICVPGGAPYVAHPVENSIHPVRYPMHARRSGSSPAAVIRALGWGHLIPRECLADLAGQTTMERT